MFNINTFLVKAVAIEASDVHLHINEPPLIRKNGTIVKTAMAPLTEKDLEDAFRIMAPEKYKNNLEETMDLDFVYEIPGKARFRINYNRQLNNPSFVIRIIPLKIKTFEELKLPENIKHLIKTTNGIVLVTGPTGSGKSTTLAAIIDWFNTNFAKHILTIEDPVEYIFKTKKSVVSQRQVGIDTATFADGLKYALRQDPDVILIGEIRDRATAEAALKAAETGHMVFSTLHTNDAVQTITRIINMFEKNDRENVKGQLAEVLRGTVAQKLVFSKEHNRRFAALEVMAMTSTVKDYIKKDNLEGIYQLLNANQGDMLSMNESLLRLVKDGKLSQEEALAQSNSPEELSRTFRCIFYSQKADDNKAEEIRLETAISNEKKEQEEVNTSDNKATVSRNSLITVPAKSIPAVYPHNNS
ncbi:MAG: type IV pilus twitching motility protein PilT [Candidatus Gastranaerophilaceae bacterium]